jgi:hypothetical protein
MAWPTPQDYNEAVQNPQLAFTDSELRAGQAELNAIGLPRPITGGFACVYKIQSGARLWAARCFLSEVRDQQHRYEAISRHLEDAKLVHAVPFSYLAGGIKVQGRSYPLVKMQWVQGESLSAFVGRSIGYPDTLFSLAKVWSRLLLDLKAANIAHGDLQHGNVLVVGDQLRLLDYDGMFVPSLSGKQSNELGHRNYQLPARSPWDYGPHLDNFAAWVIYVSLVALAVHPELWAKHRGGDECLLFRRVDFEQPDKSALVRDLTTSPNPELRILVDLFVGLFSLAPQDVPALDGNLTKVTVATSPGYTETRPAWCGDHIGNQAQQDDRPLEDHVPETETTTADPGWILDSLMDQKLGKPVVLQAEVKEVRVLMAGSFALLALTSVLASIPASQITILATCIFGLDLLFCYIRFNNDPCQAEFAIFKQESKALARRVKEQQLLIDSICSERLSAQERLAVNEHKIVAQKSRRAGSLQAELNSANAELGLQLEAINRKRRDLSSSEASKLHSIQGTIGKQISDLDHRLSGLSNQEAAEKSNALATLLDRHVQSYLRSHPVDGSWVPGIGAAYKSRLAASGFVTAADIDWTVSRVHGIGPTRQSALVSWRQTLESEARRSPPQLSQQDRWAIENKYRQECASIGTAKQQFQMQFDIQVASTKQFFSEARQRCSDEEQQLRAASAQRKAQIQKDHSSEIAELDKQIVAARNHATPTLNDSSSKLQQAQKHIFGLRWQMAKHEKEGQRFSSIRFQNYLRKIVKA